MADTGGVGTPLLLADGPDDCAGAGAAKQPAAERKGVRLVSLDVLRGITIALMIFVDFAGESWAAVDHAAWDGARLADFVMPSFDFIVGVSVVMSQRAAPAGASRGSQWARLRAVLLRAAKLFILVIRCRCELY